MYASYAGLGPACLPTRPALLRSHQCGQTVAGVQRTQSHLLRMISTLEADFLRQDPPPSLEALENYAEGSSSQLLYLQVRCPHTAPQQTHEWSGERACAHPQKPPEEIARQQRPPAAQTAPTGCMRHAWGCVQGRMAGVDSQHYDHAASHLGKAVGLVNILRGTAFHAAR